MPIVVFDDFNRPDSSTSMGTATTGQVWANVPGEGHASPGDPYGILSGQGWWNRDGSGAGGDGLAALETGIRNGKASVRFMDVTAGGVLNLRNMGILFRYVDATHYMFATYARAGGGLWRLYIADGDPAPIHRGPDSAAAPVNGDTLQVTYCGNDIGLLLNGVMQENYPITISPGLSATLLGGTQCGLQSSGGIISAPPFQLFEDFTVETNNSCEGAEWILPALTWTAEGIVESDTPTGGVRTMRFDQGAGSSYYYVAPITDSGNELTTKNMKSVRATGRFTNASAKLYRYDVAEGINMDDLEDGTNSTTGAIPIPDTTLVTQSPELNVNVTNCALSTVRIEGDDTGQSVRDELHEVVLQVADGGVRR